MVRAAGTRRPRCSTSARWPIPPPGAGRAFLLTVPLAARFPQLSEFQRLTYFVTLLASGAAAILLIAPTAYHRVLFRLGGKEHLLIVAHRLTLAGLACVALSIVGALLFVTDLLFDSAAAAAATATAAALMCLSWWCVAPLLRRRRIRSRRTLHKARR